MLDADPTLRSAYVVDSDSDPDHVIVTIAARGWITCDISILRAKYDPFQVMALIFASNSMAAFFNPAIFSLPIEIATGNDIQKLTARFPGLEVVHTCSPPFRALDANELAALRAEIARARPDVIWIGLGTPKQEKFMAAHWRDFDAGVLIGVGAAFDFHSGRVPQAPRWMQRSGLEWLFRLGTEPRRLGWRYLTTNPLFVLRVLAQKCGLKKYPLN